MALDDPLDSGGLGFLGGGGGGGWSDLLPLGAAAVGVLGGDQNAIGRMVPLMMSQQRYNRAEQMKTAEADDLAKIHGALADSIKDAAGDATKLPDLFQERFGALGLQTKTGQATALKLIGETRKDAMGQMRQRQELGAINEVFGTLPPNTPMTRGQFIQHAFSRNISPETIKGIAPQLPEQFTIKVSEDGTVTAYDLANPGRVTQLGSKLVTEAGLPPQIYNAETKTLSPAVGGMYKLPVEGGGGGFGQVQGTPAQPTLEPVLRTPKDVTFNPDVITGLTALGEADKMDERRLQALISSSDPVAAAHGRELLGKYQDIGEMLRKEPTMTPEDYQKYLTRGIRDPRMRNLPTQPGIGVSATGGTVGPGGVVGEKLKADEQARLDYARSLGAQQTAEAGPRAAAETTGRLQATQAAEADEPYRIPGMYLYSRQSERPVNITKGQARDKGVMDDLIAVDRNSHNQLTLVKGALPLFDASEQLVNRLLATSQGGNLAKGALLDVQKRLGDPDVAQFKQLITQLNFEGGRILGGSVRVPVTMLKMLEGTMPSTYSSAQAALRELRSLRTDLKNRINTMLDKPTQPISTGSGQTYLRATPFGTANFDIREGAGR